jgi:hypothetical protein
MIGIPVLAVVVFGVVYACKRQYDDRRQYDIGDPRTALIPNDDQVPPSPTPALAAVRQHPADPTVAPASAAEQKSAPAKTSKVRCYKCQHVQVVPVSQSKFTCEQCNTKPETARRPGLRPMTGADRSYADGADRKKLAKHLSSQASFKNPAVPYALSATMTDLGA